MRRHCCRSHFIFIKKYNWRRCRYDDERNVKGVVRKDYKQERQQVSRAHGNAEGICNRLLWNRHQLFTWREVQWTRVTLPNNNNNNLIVINIDHFSKPTVSVVFLIIYSGYVTALFLSRAITWPDHLRRFLQP